MKKDFLISLILFIIIISFCGWNFVKSEESNQTVLLLHFDDCSGNIAYDSSEKSYDGEIHGPVWSDGISGCGLNFDGLDDYILIENHEDFNSHEFTLETWFKADSINPSVNQNMIDKFVYGGDDNAGPSYGFGLGYGWNGKLRVFTGRGDDISSAEVAQEMSQTTVPDVWYHLAGTYNGTTLKLYLNGSLVASKETKYSPSSVNLVLGMDPIGVEYFNGTLDEVKISNYAKSSEEIMASYLEFAQVNKIVSRPTSQSLIISNKSWQNIISVIPANQTLIVSDDYDQKTQKFISEYGPDNIYTLGIDLDLPNSYKMDIETFLKLFFPNATKAFYVKNKDKAIYASALGKILGIPIIFNKSIGNFSEILDLEILSIKEIQKIFLKEVKRLQNSVNFIILANSNNEASVFSGLIAADKNAFDILVNLSVPVYPDFEDIENPEDWNSVNNISGIKQELENSIEYLKDLGMYDKELNYIKGNYLLLLGNIPYMVKKDPVDNNFMWNDVEDNNWYLNDLDYGDIDNDGYIELAVGRYPNDIEDTSLLYAEQKIRTNNKNALVSAEYLHRYWPIVLLYLGGGMWNGKNIETVLINQNYSVTRLVEYRSDLKGLIESFTPSTTLRFIDTAKTLSNKFPSVFGNTLTQAAMKVLFVIKILEYIEDALEIYLEYNWTSRESNTTKIEEILEGPPEDLEGKIDDLMHMFFSERLPELSKNNLVNYIHKSDIIYYNGVGNGTDWILPNEYDQWDVFGSPYNGTNSFNYNELSHVRASIVWDNSNLGSREFGPEFINSGSLSYIGSSAIVYTPYSDEMDVRFFNEENTIGQSFIKAVNDFSENWFIWDPINFIKGDSIKSKMLRSYILFGDPSLKKDPFIEEKYIPKTKKFCMFGICIMRIEFSPDYEMIGTEGKMSIVYKHADNLLEAYKPILPIYKFDYSLPEDSKILAVRKIKDKRKIIENVFSPVLVPVSHGGEFAPGIDLDYGTFPEKFYRIDKSDGLKIIFSPIQMKYNDTAIIHKETSFFIVYKVPAEIWIESEDEIINLKVKNMKRKTLKGKLFVEISNGNSVLNQTKEISVKRSFKEKDYEFLFENLPEGYYRARVFLFADDFILGPRYHYFKIE